MLCLLGKGGETIKELQERAGCKMQMIQDGPFANTPEKPLRMTGFPENCKVCSPYPSWFDYSSFVNSSESSATGTRAD